MDLGGFKSTLDASAPPAGLGPALKALWYDAKGNWDEAHHRAQAAQDESGAWVHAYLHRVEGDHGNAAYWYRRAGRPVAKVPLREEWEAIAQTLLRGIDA